MSMMLMVSAMQQKVGSSTRKLVLLKLADNANDKGQCFPSYQHIADQCEISKRAAIEHIKQLETDGFLIIKRRKTDKGNTSNIYQLTLKPSELSASGVVQYLHQGSAESASTPSAESAPRISHSSEPVNESKKKNNKKENPIFKKPSIEQIADYCEERKNGLDPEQIFDHYEANGWVRGKTKVKDWKACVRTWEKSSSASAMKEQSNQFAGYR